MFIKGYKNILLLLCLHQHHHHLTELHPSAFTFKEAIFLTLVLSNNKHSGMKWQVFISEHLHVTLHPQLLVCTVNTVHLMKGNSVFTGNNKEI